MKALLPIVASLLLFSSAFPSVHAQFQSGGVDKEGSWYAGEGLKKGDYFSYSMCHVDYKECVSFGMDMWIKGDIKVGSETKWLAETVVYDGSKIVVGTMELGKIAPEPTGGSEELGIYRGAFKSSIVWLSAFATSDGSSGGKGPKEFTAKSWGKIANIGGEQILPTAIEKVTVPAGTWETVQVSWKTGGYVSKVWIVDDFPFPIKAKTYTHVSSGIPPVEYEFALLKYAENIQNPFEGIKSTADQFIAQGCDTNFEKEVSVKKPTNYFGYQLHVFYGPEDPVQGCEMQWLIKFISKYDDAEFLNQVQFDVLVVDDKSSLTPLRSIAQEEGRKFLYSPSGQYILDMIVKENPGEVNYVVWIYGLAPDWTSPTATFDYLVIPIQVFAGKNPAQSAATAPAQGIPAWIKTNAGWWAEGKIGDETFVQGIQFLIKEGILKVTSAQGGGSGSGEIPAWIKTNAGWWAEGKIGDETFVQGIQFLIKEGILKVTSAQGGGSGSGEIPAWIKTNAGWWAEGKIGDETFVQGIQFLIKEGILDVS